MKKIVSMLIVFIMVMTTAVFAIPAGAKEGLPVDEVEAPYFDVKPIIDGIVSEEEWGEPTVWVDQQDAAQVVLPEDNPEASEHNTFFYRLPGGGFDVETLNMSYMMWLRWDEDNFYVAVKAYDPDGHSLKNGKNETWNGDALQMRIDPEGYNASSVQGPEFYDAEYDGKPWSRSDVSDFCLGFVQAAGGFTEAWNNAVDQGITPFAGGNCDAEIVPANAITEKLEYYSSDAENGVTVYEVAIPWNNIDTYKHNYSNYTFRNPNGAIGREYGMTAVLYNADGFTGSASYNAGLSWGSGIINVQQSDYTQTCGGSNKVTLSGDKVSEDGFYSTPYENDPNRYHPYIPTPEYDTSIDETNHTVLTFDDPRDLDTYGGDIDAERIQDEDGNWVLRWYKSDFTASGWNDRNYLSTENNYHSRGCCYTMDFDVKVIDLQTFEGGYPSTLYSWFGGSSTVDYECGYDFDMGKFILRESKSGKILEEVQADFTLDEWHHWVFQYNKDTSEMRFYFDPEMEDGHVSKDAVPMFSMIYRYFDCPGRDECELIFRRLNVQIMMDNVQFYNFVDFPHYKVDPIPPEPTALPGDADGNGDVNVKDVLLMRKAIAGADTIAVENFVNADIMVDGSINMKDVLLVRKIIAGAEPAEFKYPEN